MLSYRHETIELEINEDPEERVTLCAHDVVPAASQAQTLGDDVTKCTNASVHSLPLLQIDRPARRQHLQTYDTHSVASTSHADLLFPDIYSSPSLSRKFSSCDNVYKRKSGVDLRQVSSPLIHCSDDVTSAEDTKRVKQSSKAAACWAYYKQSDVHKVLSNSDARLSIAVYVTMSFAVIGYEEVYTVFASTDRSLGNIRVVM